MDMDYQVLLVSQFTLLASTKKGNKPDFHGACPPDQARDMYMALLEKTRELYTKEKGIDRAEGDRLVQDGVFGAMMQVALVNDGPVTFEVNTTPQLASNKGTPKATPKGTPKGTPKQKTPRGRDVEDITTKVDELLVSDTRV